MDLAWLSTSPEEIIVVFLSTLSIYIILVALTRLAGLRAFARMSSFDFALTFAVGTLVASTILTPETPILQGAVAIASIFIFQIGVDYIRIKLPRATFLFENQPMLLMKDAKVLEKNLKKARVTRHELRQKLSKANVMQMAHVKAVVLESTGEVSVLHTEGEHNLFDEELIGDVRTYE